MFTNENLSFEGAAELDWSPHGHQPGLAHAVEQAAERARSARADNTVRAYRSDLADFEAWCARVNSAPLPTPALTAVYLDQLARAGAKVSTIRRRLAALNARLRTSGAKPMSGRDEPLASVLRGIRREIGAPAQGARPLELYRVRTLTASCCDDLAGKRDRALILVGFAGAFRRSELAGLCWRREDRGAGYIQLAPEGLRIHLRRSKTNQTGEREEVAICRGAYASTCPVRAVEDWANALLEQKGGSPIGPVFPQVDRHGNVACAPMDGGSIARIIRRAVTRAAEFQGASAAEIEDALQGISGHSLRSGLVTTAFAAGLSAEDVMRQTRHRDVKTLVGYRRHATAFVANVSGRVGL